MSKAFILQTAQLRSVQRADDASYRRERQTSFTHHFESWQTVVSIIHTFTRENRHAKKGLIVFKASTFIITTQENEPLEYKYSCTTSHQQTGHILSSAPPALQKPSEYMHSLHAQMCSHGKKIA